ncbi:hypothetical protein EDC02_0840 [Micromonospora sp. Llam0]|uniref:hypothetical protein n=1 Tax=Micromonospora sp. Llam0 TaxID=2485143 RepID=UPI000F48D899|nr:hypothetical protein [Micromonospora sp. Llam0]ROO59055.1 hypothetical protein EDC02_0840 [Micromonospora sp. Llam0]
MTSSTEVAGADGTGKPDVVDHQGKAETIWTGPGDFGQPAAYDAKTGVAAPLLAGFSLALLGVVAQAPTSFRWPGATLTTLVVVCAVLVMCVQFGFRGRAVLYSKADVEAWGRLTTVLAPPAEQRLRARVQRNDMLRWRRWHRRTQLSYNAGIALLFIAIALALAPPESYGGNTPLSAGEAAWRWAGTGLAGCVSLAEIIWTVRDEVLLHRRRRAAHSDQEP